jgi:hypothetical protein
MPRYIGVALKKIERVEIKGGDANGNPIVVGHKVKIELMGQAGCAAAARPTLRFAHRARGSRRRPRVRRPHPAAR